MAKKYTNLTRLVCSDFVSQYLNLDITERIYRDGIIPIYKNIGKHLHYFDAKNAPAELEVFKQMDDIGCRFSLCDLKHNGTRPIFSQLAQSNQAIYLKELQIEKTTIDSPSLFQNMTCLTRLNIDTDRERGYWPMNLTEYLNGFPPSLVDFSVNCTDMEISELPAGPSKIQRLYINCTTLSEELANLISNFFPDLCNLSLSGGVQENIIMDLSSNHLLDLSVETYYEEGPHGFSVDPTDGSPVKYYVGSRDVEWHGPENLNPATPEDLQDRITIELKYSAEKFHFSTTHIDDMF
jgi:hypothetical protein